MSDLIKEEQKEPVVYKAKIDNKKSISFVWILPLIILGILGWIAYESYMKKGTNITVVFKSAEGLKENVTPLEYKGLQLGKVTKISMHEDLKSVKVNILVNNDVAKYVASESSDFWIKKPTVSLTKVSGLNTLISGYKIELSPKFRTQEEYNKGVFKNYFEGLDSQPNDELDDNGYYISLLANDKSNIEVGTPIFYNKFQIGEITAKEFVFEKVYFTAYIYDKFNYLVNKSSKFVINEALKVNYGASGLNIELGSLYSALVGGVTVVTPNKDEQKISKDEVYILFGKEDDLKKKEYFTINFTDVNGIEQGTPIIFKGIETIKTEKDFIYFKSEVEIFLSEFKKRIKGIEATYNILLKCKEKEEIVKKNIFLHFDKILDWKVDESLIKVESQKFNELILNITDYTEYKVGDKYYFKKILEKTFDIHKVICDEIEEWIYKNEAFFDYKDNIGDI